MSAHDVFFVQSPLKDIVANQGDSDLAYIAAGQVSGVFDVKNELQVEQRVDEKVSRK